MSIDSRPAGKPKVAVIGGGWAGLAAAEALAGQAEVTLFEAGKTLGGRARAVAADSNSFDFLDNGQHLLVGAYQQCLALLARAGVAETEAFLRLPLTWHMADGVQFQAARLPSPWHLLLGVLGAKGATWGEKTALLRQMRAYLLNAQAVAGTGDRLQRRQAAGQGLGARCAVSILWISSTLDRGHRESDALYIVHIHVRF